VRKVICLMADSSGQSSGSMAAERCSESLKTATKHGTKRLKDARSSASHLVLLYFQEEPCCLSIPAFI
jgi:hypothetical protein